MPGISNFFRMPIGAGPNDLALGEVDGSPIYSAPNGTRYYEQYQPPTQTGPYESLATALDPEGRAIHTRTPNAPTPLRDMMEGLVGEAARGLTAPGRALRGEPVTYGDTWATALDWGIPSGGAAATQRYDPNVTRIFGGKTAKTADMDALARAERMAAEGVDRADVWRDTGWFKGVDGQWRFEIDDSAAKLDLGALSSHPSERGAYRAGPVPEGLLHDDLFAAYDDFSDATLVKYPWEDTAKGEYSPRVDLKTVGAIPEQLTVWDGMGDDLSTALHEAQHGIQGREGFAFGSNPTAAKRFAPENPRFRAHMENIDKVENARGYYNSPSYARDLEAQNARFKDYWQPKLDALDAGLTDDISDAAFDAWSKNYDDILEASKVEAAQRWPNMAYLDDVARKYGLETPDRTISGGDTYRRMAGEVESRNVQARRYFTPEQRLATPPWETMDVPEIDQIVRKSDGAAAMMADDTPTGIRAYHGSPHDFDRFQMDKIGTGEGAQAYGHGLYFAESEDVARGYRERLAGGVKPGLRPSQHSDVTKWWDEARELFPDDPKRQAAYHWFNQMSNKDSVVSYFDDISSAPHNKGVYRYPDASGNDVVFSDRAEIEALADEFFNPGRMYEVNINANPDDFLDWDAPLPEGSPVRGMLDEAAQRDPGLRGHSAIAKIDANAPDIMGSKVWTAETLREAGIPGIKYKDGFSRGAEGGTRNFVVFDDELVSIVRKYGIAGAASYLGMPEDEIRTRMGDM